jgi:hypothetical protein
VRTVTAKSLLLLAMVSIAGCGSSVPAGKKPSEGVLRDLTLRAKDLPRAFTAFVDGPEAVFDLQPVLRRDPKRFDRQGGWVARYRRNGGPRARGLLTLVSGVEVFARPSGAKQYLGAIEKQDEQTAPATNLGTVRVPAVGDETYAVATPKSVQGSVRYVIVTWRDGRFVGTLSASGFSGAMKIGDVIALVRRQQRRIAAVS